MSALVAVAQREMRERKMVFAGAAIVALVPFLFSMLPSAAQFPRAGSIAASGGLLAIWWAVGLAAVLGTTLLSRELAERRLTFYLTKPVSASALWFGKLLAAVVMIVATSAVILVPSLSFGWTIWENSWNYSIGVIVLATLVASVATLLLVHAISTTLRSRSPWVLADMLGAAALIGVTWILVQPLLRRLTLDNVVFTIWIVAGGLVLSIIPAGVWQIARGRSDIRANHAALSKFTWAASIVVLGAAAAFVAWVLSAGPAHLEYPHIAQAPAGNWAWLSGKARNRGDYRPMLLLNTATGKHFSVAGNRFEPSFSSDGQALVWARYETRLLEKGKIGLFVSRLDGERPRHIATGLGARWFDGAVLSGDGRRLAAIGDGLLTVTDVETGRILGSVKTPEIGYNTDLFFAEENTIRIYQSQVAGNEKTLRAYEFDVSARKLSRTGETTRKAKAISWHVDATGRRMLLNAFPPLDGVEGVTVLDGRTLQRLSGEPITPHREGSLMLANGDVLLVERGSSKTLRVSRKDGTSGPRIALPPSDTVSIAGEVAPSKVLILLPSKVQTPRRFYDVLVVDLNAGKIERREQHLGLTVISNGADPRVRASEPGRPRLITDGQQFWTWNPLTGERKKLTS